MPADSARKIVVESHPRRYSADELMAPLGGTPLWVERPDGTRLAPGADLTAAVFVDALLDRVILTAARTLDANFIGAELTGVWMFA